MKFTFKNVMRDIERLIESRGNVHEQGEFKIYRGTDAAEKDVIEAYFQNKAYDGLIAYVASYNAVVNCESPLFYRLSEALASERHVAKVVRLWRSMLSKRKLSYYEIAAYQKKIPEKISKAEVEKHQQWVLKGLEQYAELLGALGQTSARQAVLDESAAIGEGRVVKLKGRPDPRKIDNDLFWQLIDDSRTEQGSTAEQIEKLAASLELFGGPAIRQFSKLLEKQMRRLYHWDIWALAYLAQDGSSDDAFEGFRAWLVLQGRETVDRALLDLNTIADVVPAGGDTDATPLLSIAEIAYERRCGKPMRPSTPVICEPGGEIWQEHEVEQRYPQLARRYRRQD